MRLTVYVVLLGLLSAANTEAQTQRTDVCVKGIADAYRFRPVPFTQNEIRVTTNRNNPGFSSWSSLRSPVPWEARRAIVDRCTFQRAY